MIQRIHNHEISNKGYGQNTQWIFHQEYNRLENDYFGKWNWTMAG